MKFKYVYLLLSLFCSLLFSGCSYITEYNVKDIAVEAYMKKYEELYRAEMQSHLGEFNHRGSDFISYNLKHTSIEVVKLTEVNSEYYQLELAIKNINDEIRIGLLEKIKPITDEKAGNQFNFGNAVTALNTKQARGIPAEIERRTLMSVRKVDGDWVAQ